MDTPVGIVKAYLELNGYFVLTELPVRADIGHGYGDVTDLDIVAVRFPHPPLALPRRVRRPLDAFLGADPFLSVADDRIDTIIGEVKEGKASFNPPLQRVETIAFALRRLGCCPEELVEDTAERIAHAGEYEMEMPGATRCRVRLIAFAGYATGYERGMRTVALGHCDAYIAQRLEEARDVLDGVSFKDPVLGLYALQDKLARLTVATGAL